jgi:hypothetical protein
MTATPTPQAGDPVRALEALEKHFTLPQGDNDTRLQMLGYIATVKQAVPPSPMPAIGFQPADIAQVLRESMRACGCNELSLGSDFHVTLGLPSVPRKEGE